jgi:hypothetical protein
MKKRYPVKNLLFISLACLVAAIASCKKDSPVKTSSTTTTTIATPVNIGMYETDSSIYKLIYLDISKVGTQEIDDGMIFDTGSGGMVLDAQGELPKSMITSTGFNFTGDSVVYDGITITNDTSHIEYGDDANTDAYVYGNLAYANVVVDEEGGNVTIKRLPFFLYYKAVDGKGNVQEAHDFDVFGVNEENDVPPFSNGVTITSPFSAYTPGTGLSKGFKMAALGTSNFSLDGTYVKNVVTLGLTTADLGSTSGFTFSQIKEDAPYGYPPIIPASITYDSKTISADVLFDTGTEPDNYIEDPTSGNTGFFLPAGSAVTSAINSGFNYDFTVTNTDYITYVENPRTSGADFSVFSLEYFLDNEYLLDYADHPIKAIF